MKKELLEGFRNAEEFAYMKEYEPWEKIVIRELKLSLSSKWLYINEERCIVCARFFLLFKIRNMLMW